MVRGPQPITTENNMFQCDKFIVHAVHLNFYHFSSAFFFFFCSGETTSENKDVVSVSVFC